MKRAVHILVVLAFVAALIAPGCYTVVSHPKDERGYRASQSTDCTRCHTNFDEYPYGYYYAPYPDHWWTYEKYGLYYAYPWWWSYYDQDQYVGRGTKFDPRDPHQPPIEPYPGGPIFMPSPVIITTPYDPGGSGGGTGNTGKPGDAGDTDNSDTGKETRQSNVGKPSGPKTTSGGSGTSGGSTNNNSGNSSNNSGSSSNTSGGKIDKRKGKP